MFTALTVISAYIKIPLQIIPISLQTTVVILSGALLGSRMGALSQILYLTLGLIGLPVFTQGGGISYVLKPSFGYIIGYIFASYVIGRVIEWQKNTKLSTLLTANLCGLLAIYLVGVPYMYGLMNYVIATPITLVQAVYTGFLVFLPKDLLVVFIVAFISQKILKQIPQIRAS